MPGRRAPVTREEPGKDGGYGLRRNWDYGKEGEAWVLQAQDL